MGDIGALRGVWNIVPTPFLPDGSLDTASIPTLVDFVRATGVDGLTILGVLGEAARLGDDERATVLRTAIDAAAGGIPVCVGVSHASTDRAIAYAREAEAAGAHSVDARPSPARPADRRRAAPPLPRRRERHRHPDRRPGPPGIVGRPDERPTSSLPSRPRRRPAA